VLSFLVGFIFDRNQLLIIDLSHSEISFWYIAEAFPAMGFFLTGYALKSFLVGNQISVSAARKLIWVPLGLIILVITIGQGFESGSLIHVDMSIRQYGNYFWFIVNAYIGILFSFLLVRSLSIRSRLLQYIGEHSIIFYGLNGFNIFILDNFILAIDIFPEDDLLVFLFSIVYIFASQIVFLPLAFLLKKYAPVLVGRFRFRA
jgi:hypothetical protein